MFQRKFRPLKIVSVLALLLLLTTVAASADGPTSENQRTATYEITIKNLTEGQPLTPPLLAFHHRAAGYFNIGQEASTGIREIAENGNPAPAVSMLEHDRRVNLIFAGSEPLVPAGTPGGATFSDEVTYTIEAPRRSRYLFYASMLICTNDGFTGVDVLRLPGEGDSVTTYAGSLDAGSEINTEDFADIVPPCQALIGVSSNDPGTGMSNPALAEHGVISTHTGIDGGVDLDPAIHGWVDPVVEISVTRLPDVREYEVTLTNLTGGQPLTPPVIATHKSSTSLFNVGDPASAGIQAVAENGDLPTLLNELAGNGRIFDVVAASEPLVPQGTPGAAMFGDSVTLTITGDNGFNRLSFASMLICTNDGFAGADSVRLPRWVEESTTFYANGYDAGTELNTEDFADIVPPCQGLIGVTSSDPGTGMSNPALAENGVVHEHQNIQGGDDLLPDIHGWEEPVVMITITRTK